MTSSSASSAESLKQQKKNKKKMEQIDKKKCLISEFNKIKERIINSESNQTLEQIENAIARKLGTTRVTVYKWKRDLGMSAPTPPAYSQKQKRKIVDNFTKLKSKIRSQFPSFSFKEIENAASKKFNVCAKTINRWKKKIDPSSVLENKHYSAAHKMELMKKYHEIKKNDPNSKETDIAVQLKIPPRTLSTWKKELDLVQKQNYSNKEKMELIQKFEKMKSKQSQSSSKMSEQIAKELGVSYFTICRWKRQLDLKRKPTYTESDKMKLMEKYFKIKRRHPELSDVKISKRLNINNSNMWKWRQQFVNKNANSESSSNDERPKKKQLERKRYSDKEKMELTRKYYQIIKSDPKRSNVDIAEQLNINLNTLRGWKLKRIGKQNLLDDCHGQIKSVGIMDSSPCQTMPTGIAWKWNRCTKERKQRKCRRCVLN
uniref:Transposase n=1 Tax=Globodera rostochiensis TaxID=31243 RepID=A0A914I2F3_GLORO